MQILEEHFNRFKEIYKEEFGEDEFNKMTEEELRDSAMRLVTFMEAVYKHKNKIK